MVVRTSFQYSPSSCEAAYLVEGQHLASHLSSIVEGNAHAIIYLAVLV